MKEDYQKPFKKLTLFFASNPVPFNGQSYKKQKGLGTSDQSLFRLQNKFTKISLLVILSGQIWWCDIKQFLSYSKNYTCKSMQANSWHHKLFCFHYSSELGKCGREEEKLQKLEYLENEKSCLDEIKNTFHSFWRAIIWWKNENLTKKSRQKLRPFQERRAITCARIHTYAKVLRSVINHTRKWNFWLHVFPTLLPVFDQDVALLTFQAAFLPISVL